MSLTPFNGWPFPSRRGVDSIFDVIDASWDRSFDDFFPFPSFPFPSLPFPSSVSSSTRVDWRETPDAHVFKADLPGVKKNEVKVEVEDGSLLRISGQRSHECEENSDTWHRYERSSGCFFRQFRLPENARLDRIRAAMEDGVLTVTVPKERVDARKPDIKSIEISG